MKAITPIIVTAALAAVVFTSTYPNPTITVRDSGNNGELVTTIPVNKTGTARDVVYSIPVGDLGPGDTLLIQAEYEATNNLGYNVMLGSYVTLADSPTATSGRDITEANTFNVTPDMHHGVPVKVGSLAVTEPLTDQYVNLISYSAAYLAAPGATLRIEQDYGHLVVTVISNG